MRVQAEQQRNRWKLGTGKVLGPLCVAALLGAALASSRAPWTAAPELVAAPGQQVHYLPFDAQQFLTTLRGQLGSSTNVNSPVRLISSIVSARDGNTVAIDHWEDGYDADPIAGPGATTEVTTMNEGQTQVLDNEVDVTKIGQLSPNGDGQPYYDGRDKIVSTAPTVVTAGGWPSGATTLHAGASAVPEVSRYGYDFVSPVGEDTPFPALSPTLSLWEYTGLIVAASQDNTTVTVAGGAPFTLNEGETSLVDGGINVGDAIHADKPVAVYLSTGDNVVQYEGRLFELTPTERWSDEYFSPVTSTNDTNEVTRVFVYNPGSGAISVDYTRSDGGTGTISVPAGGQADYRVPTDIGVKFSSPGNPFYALQAITTPEDGNDSSSAYNWGFSLIPARYLTPMVVLGYAPGSSNLTENDSAVWVSAEANTTIYIDRDGDTSTGANTDVNGNKYDFSCVVTALTPRLLKDNGGSSCYTASGFTNGVGTGDADMTGARVYTLDGTRLAAAWGQVPGLNSVTPAIDMGTTVLPFPTIDLNKTSDIIGDDGDGLADPGETIRYTITASNAGIAPADALVMIDEIPANTTYTLGSTLHDGNPIADDGSGTPFPLDGAGTTLPPALAVGQTRTVTFDVVVDQPLADGVTQIENEATLATSYGTYVAVDIQPTAPPEPSIAIAKTVYRGHDDGASCEGADTAYGQNGDAVTYCFVVENDGATNLSPVTIADVALGIDQSGMVVLTGDLTALAPGESADLYYETTIDGDLTNTATVTGTPADAGSDPLPDADDVTDSDTAEVDEVALAVSVAKTVYRGHDDGVLCDGAESVVGVNGDEVTYCFTVTNDGDTYLAPVAVTDAQLAIDQTGMTSLPGGNLGLLAPGDSAHLYFESTIDGDLTNTAAVSGTPADANGTAYPGLDPATDSDDAAVDEVAPEVSVAKTVYGGHDLGVGCPGAESTTGLDGDAVTYCFVVTNEGDTRLAPVTLADGALGIDESAMTLLTGDLTAMAPGDTATLYFQTFLTGDLTNTATVTGVPADGSDDPLPGVDPVTGDDDARVDSVGPAVTVAKTVYRGHDSGASCAGVDSLAGRNGEDVTYCFVVTNSGDTDLSPVTIEDNDLGLDEGDMTLLPGGDLSLLPAGDSVTLYYQTAINGDLDNTATVTGTPVDGGGDQIPGIDPVEDDDNALVDEVDPVVSIAKTVYRGHDAGAGCPGADSVQTANGAAVTYCFVVSNDGDTPLSPVAVVDPDLAVDQTEMTLFSGSLAPLAPGASATLFYETDVAGDLTNTATVTGTATDSGGTPLVGVDPVTDADQAEVDEVGPSITIAKTVYAGHDSGASCAGAELVTGANGAGITYCFVVSNNGDVDLSPVTVADLALGIDESEMAVRSGDLDSLAPGDSATLYFQTVLDGDLTNTATATGTPVDGSGVPIPGLDPVTANDSAEVNEVTPSVEVAKTVYRGHDSGASCEGSELVSALNGDAITYCFVVTNNGGSTLAPVTIDDAALNVDQSDMAGAVASLASLDPGDSATLYFETTVDGDLTNTAEVTGTPVDGNGDPLPGGQDVTDDDDAQVDEIAPALSVAKTVYRGHDSGAGCAGTETATGVNGDAVTYCFFVTNDGDTDLAPVTIADGDLSIDQTDMSVLSGTGSLASLSPGQTARLYYETTINGDLTNTATVSGTPVDDAGDPLPGVDPVTGDDTAQVDEVAPAMTILTEVLDPFTGDHFDADGDAATLGSNDPTPASFRSGDTASFRFTVANTGDAAITDVAVDAPQCDAIPAVVGGDSVNPGVLDVVETWVLTCDVANLTAGMTMAATVTADSADGPPAGSGDSETADTQVASISVEKTVQDPDTGDFVDSASLETGGDATFQIVVTNTGEVPLSGATVSDTLAPGCDHAFTDTLDPGDSFASYTCVVRGVDEGFVNTATATATPVDDRDQPVGDDVADEDAAVVGVDAPLVTDLAITKDLIDIDESIGTATWQIAVTNLGETTATEPIVVTDDLPPELGYRDAFGEGWICEFVDPTVVCVTDTDLAPGDSTSFTVETYVLADPNETVTNVARVDGIDDTNTDNNTDEAVVDVNAQGDPVPVIPTELPRTGADIAGLLATAGLLILTGLAFRRSARRRVAG